MKNWRNLITLDMMFKVLIGLQLLAGLFLIVFTNIGLGLGLFGVAALIYIGMQVLKHLASLRELLTYSLFKQGNPQQDTLSHAPHTRGAPVREPETVPESVPRPVRSAAPTHSDELRQGT